MENTYNVQVPNRSAHTGLLNIVTLREKKAEFVEVQVNRRYHKLKSLPA